MMNLYYSFCSFCSSIVAPLTNLFARVYLGYYVFFVSGLQKASDMEETIELFKDDFAIPLLPAEPAAYLATAGELVLPVLLILGLFTRFSALGLLVMTLVIQFFVFDLSQHYVWMAALGLLVGYGGSKLSLDNFLFKGKA